MNEEEAFGANEITGNIYINDKSDVSCKLTSGAYLFAITPIPSAEHHASSKSL